MGISLKGTVSLEEVSMLMGHMAQTTRAHENKELGAKIQEQTKNKEETRDQIKAIQDDLRALQQQARAEHEEDDDDTTWRDLPFADDRWQKTEEQAAKQAIAVEKQQVELTDAQDQLESLRSDAKDENEAYDTSRKLYESVQQELEASKMTPLL
jgi:hypothetical protein